MGYYRIADLILQIEDNGIRVQKELDSFQIDGEDISPDIYIEFDKNDFNMNFLQLNTYKGKRLLFNDYVSIYEDDESFYVTFYNATFFHGYRVLKNEKKAVVYCANIDYNILNTYDVKIGAEVPLEKSGPEMLVNAIRDIFLFYAADFGRIAVHSASIIYKEKAWLFSALSGVGKSTHVNMWKEAGIPCEDMNGDLALIYLKDGKPMAGGMPWCGTSEIYRAGVCELGGILYIKRDEQDYVTELNNSDGVIEMVARNVTPAWNRQLMDKVIDISLTIVPNITSGVLRCTPTKNAAFTAQQFIDQNRGQQ